MSRGADRPACRRPCILAICATAALPLQAATAADEAVSLEPVVVSTTRTETPVSELTRSVTVVPEEELQRQVCGLLLPSSGPDRGEEFVVGPVRVGLPVALTHGTPTPWGMATDPSRSP